MKTLANASSQASPNINNIFNLFDLIWIPDFIYDMTFNLDVWYEYG